MGTISQEPVSTIAAGLFAILLLVLILPFMVKRVEENLEFFFFVMGAAAVTVSGLWSLELLKEALRSPVMIGGVPIGIFQAVLVAGLLFYYFNKPFHKGVRLLTTKLGPGTFIFILIFVLGLVCSFISVIVTSVILAEVILACPLQREDKIKLTVLTCFALGLGAVLTPLGEPLSTILVAKLASSPYNAGFFFPIEILGVYVIPGVGVIAAAGAIYLGRKTWVTSEEFGEAYTETLKGAVLRAVKVFVFVAALLLLGKGLSPLIVWYLGKMPGYILYWINSVSAILDNATVMAVEMDPSLSLTQIKSITMSLLIAGGMLIPGNIPNIVAAGRLRISMKEWGIIGVPIGVALMFIYFAILMLFP